MTDQERLAKLEGALERLDKDIREIKDEQLAAIERQQRAELDTLSLRENLAKLVGLLDIHQKWHDKHDEQKYKLTDIILTLGMISIAIMELLKK